METNNKISYYFTLYFTYFYNEVDLDSKSFKNIKELKNYIIANKNVLKDSQLFLRLFVRKEKYKNNFIIFDKEIIYRFDTDSLFFEKIIESIKGK